MKFFFILLLLVISWVAGMLFGFPVIPWINTVYIESKTNQPLSEGFILQQQNGVTIKLEVPDYFPQDDQCFDLWFIPDDPNIRPIIKMFNMAAFDKRDTAIPSTNIYLFGHDDSPFNGTALPDFTIITIDTNYHHPYKFIRTVFDLRSQSKISVLVTTKYIINNNYYSLAETLHIKKIRQLTWNRFRVH